MSDGVPEVAGEGGITEFEEFRQDMSLVAFFSGEKATSLPKRATLSKKQDPIEAYAEDLYFVLMGDEKAWMECRHPRKPNPKSIDDVSFGAYKKKLSKIMSKMFEHSGEGLTVLLEEDHVDPSYRDLYYCHYSSKHYDVPRRSVRLSFFEGTFEDKAFARFCDDGAPGDRFLGAIVVNPINGGTIGRTLVSPKCFLSKPARVRTSKFKLTIMGRRLEVEAFPFRGQDGEALSCAEITFLNMMCYYSNEYSDYAVVLPSEILSLERQYSHERVVPSRGLDYPTFTKLLFTSGFQPRLYNVEETRPAAWSGLGREDNFKRILHWYVNSGIPVAVNLHEKGSTKSGHSVVCIGYDVLDENELEAFGNLARKDPDCPEGHSGKGEANGSGRETELVYEQALDRSYRIEDQENPDRKPYVLMHCADFYTRYVVVDDGDLPYVSNPYQRMSRSFPGMSAENYAVPLHRGMALDALDAYDTFVAIACHDKIGLSSWGEGFLEEGEKVVMKVFLASTRSYKRFRSETNDDFVGLAYREAPLPHFVWVCELYRAREYFVKSEEREVFAEIVLDATSGGRNDAPTEKMVLMRYPEKMLVFSPQDSGFPSVYLVPHDGEVWPEEWRTFAPFPKNLKTVAELS